MVKELTDQELVDLCAKACEGNLKARQEYRLLIVDAKIRGDTTRYCYLRYLAKEINECYEKEVN